MLKYKYEQCHYTSDKISNLKRHISLNHNELACLIIACYKKVLNIWNAARENSFIKGHHLKYNVLNPLTVGMYIWPEQENGDSI